MPAEDITAALAGTTILIVDDEAVLSLTMSLVLRREGATVLTAANGAQALALLEQPHSIAAMICDQNMPVMDGKTLLRTLQVRNLAVPTLFFISSLDPNDSILLRPMGVRRLLSKPIQPTDLIAAIAAVIAES